MKMNKEQVMELLPHREPFLFVDEVVSIELPKGVEKRDKLEVKYAIGAVVKTKYTTKGDHPIFAGHFPGNPILPGVVQVEMMAQGSSFFVRELLNNSDAIRLEVALVTVEHAKFKKFITPNMELDITTKCTKARGPFITNECSIHHNGELMSQATIMASMRVLEK